MWRACRPKKWRAGWIVPRQPCGRTPPTRAPSFAGIWKRGSHDASESVMASPVYGKEEAMTHPNQSILALYAGQDLGWFTRRRTERHLARCRECRDEVQVFASARDNLIALNELPAISWNRLAAEMKANIRLGLAAGECVRGERTA